MDPDQGAIRPSLLALVIQRIAAVGERVMAVVEWNGGIARLAFLAFTRGLRPPLALSHITQQLLHVGLRSLPLATLMAMFVGMILTWQFGEALAWFGATSSLGYATSLALVRELVPTLIAITVGTKMATGMAAELGSMKVTEQIDAIAALGADPIKKLVWPRVLAATISMPLLVAWSNIVAMLGGMFVSDTVFDVPAGYFYTTYLIALSPWDIVMSMTKALTFGALAGLSGCYQGFTTGHGTEAVGTSTTETVIAVSVFVLIADFLLTTLFVPV